MNCLDVQNLIVIGVYGRLTAEEREELERHLRACQECTGLYERSEPLIAPNSSDEDVPLPDWEKSWAVIAGEALDRPRPRFRLGGATRNRPGPFPWFVRLAPAAAAMLLVFVLGYFAGRSILVDSTVSAPSIASTASSIPSSQLLFADYVDSLKPVLTNFLNRNDVRPPNDLVTLERMIIRDMIAQTRLLEGLATETGDTGLQDLLLDLEFILTSMANLDPDDRQSADHLGQLIREKDVSLRLRDLASLSTI